MKLTKLLGLCTWVLFFTSCGNEDVIETPNNAKEFTINATIAQSAPAARAPQLNENGSGRFSTGDVNHLLFFSERNEILKNFEYTYGNTYYWNDIQLPSGVESCKMVAWYPAVAASNPADFAWNVVDHAENPDLLAAASVKVSPSQTTRIDLTFKHLMHKLQVNVVSENPAVTSSDLKAATITCQNFLPTAHVNLLTSHVVKADGKKASLSQTGDKTTFILPAQAAGEMEVVLNLKGKTANFKLSEIQVNGKTVDTLESGKTLSINITVTKNDFIISGQTISGWENQGEFNDSIII